MQIEETKLTYWYEPGKVMMSLETKEEKLIITVTTLENLDRFINYLKALRRDAISFGIK